jgi:hypothetical protein
MVIPGAPDSTLLDDFKYNGFNTPSCIITDYLEWNLRLELKIWAGTLTHAETKAIRSIASHTASTSSYLMGMGRPTSCSKSWSRSFPCWATRLLRYQCACYFSQSCSIPIYTCWEFVVSAVCMRLWSRGIIFFSRRVNPLVLRRKVDRRARIGQDFVRQTDDKSQGFDKFVFNVIGNNPSNRPLHGRCQRTSNSVQVGRLLGDRRRKCLFLGLVACVILFLVRTTRKTDPTTVKANKPATS